MKMTMHIDEALLARVMKTNGFATKTEAVETALKEIDRKARLRELGRTGLGLSPKELGEAVDPAYDIMELRVADKSGRYGRGRSRR